jgi:hypothetical protein
VERDMKRDEFFKQLNNAVVLRNEEHQTWLKILFASLTTNSLLLIALFKDGTFPSNSTIGIIITAFGILITFFLAIIQRRAYLTMKTYEDYSKIIEDQLKLKKYSYNKFRDKELPNIRGRARFLIEGFNYILLIGWVVFLLYFTGLMPKVPTLFKAIPVFCYL